MVEVTLGDLNKNAGIRKQTKVIKVLEHAAKLKWKWTKHNERYQDDRWNHRIQSW